MPTQEQNRLRRLLAAQEATVRGAFSLFVRDVKSDRVMSTVSDLLESGDVEAALRLVDSYVVRLGGIIPKTFQEAADRATAEIAARLGRIASGAALSFDPTDPKSAMVMRENQLEFIKEFGKEQRQATRQALSSALDAGRGSRAAARAFKDSIGLTGKQEEAVRNYGRLLQEGSSEALDRQLRDRRYDRTVARASRLGEPLRQEQIDLMVDRYRSRYLDYRAETIARTESTRVTSIARQDAVRQTVADLGLPRGGIRRVWNATQDKRTRDSHAEMDGQEVGEDEPFISGDGNSLMFPGDPSAPPSETINCRCVVTTRLL